METAREKRFYDALGCVPEVPAGILENVERHVRRSGVKRRLALAACLLLAFIIPALVLTQTDSTVATAVHAEEVHTSMYELMYAFEFLSGSGGFNADFTFGLELGDALAANDNTAPVQQYDEAAPTLVSKAKELNNEN